jgi:hypothetical protein
MKTTIQMLDHTISTMTETIAVCSASKNKKDILAALIASTSSIGQTVSYLKEHEKRRYIAVRKSLTAVSNVMGSMKDGIEDGVPFSDFRAGTKSLKTTFFPMVHKSLIAEQEAAAAEEGAPVAKSAEVASRSKIRITIAKTPEMKEALAVVATSNSAGHEVDGDNKSSPIEAMGRTARATLPVRIEGNFKLVRVPIVPIFPNPLAVKETTLKSLGFKFLMIEGICILQDQTLLNVSKSRSKSSGTNPVTLAHSVVDLINQRGATKYEVVSDTPNANPRNADLLMFWILPRPRMSGIMKIVGSSKSPAILKWGLPTSAASVDKDLENLNKRLSLPLPQVTKQAEISELVLKRNAERAKAKALREEKQKAARIEEQEKAAQKKKPVQVKPQVAVPKKSPSQRQLEELVRRNQERRAPPKRP